MKTSVDRMLVTHVGSLPRSNDVLKLIYDKANDPNYDRAAYDRGMQEAVDAAMRRQAELGFDVVNDGEQTKPSFVAYINARLGGFEILDRPDVPEPTRDALAFPGAYQAIRRLTGIRRGEQPLRLRRPSMRCTGPITYTGHDDLAADIRYTKAAFGKIQAGEAFMTAISPSNLELNYKNEFYRTGEEFLIALCDAMHVEYKAIVDAGLILQLDDPAIAENWDMVNPEPSVADYQKFTMVRVEAINHAIKGLPADRIRFHLCWGSWHGPHTTDIPMRDIVDVMLAINCQAYSFEAGNVRHEHEWTVWEDVKLPDGKLILPGVVSHATNVVEHPELVAQRIVRFANGVGRERVIAATDCGLGGRVHPMVAWAKLEALAQGAALASRELWR